MEQSDGPIVAAVRQARARIAAVYDYDLHKLGERLKRIEAEHVDRLKPNHPDRPENHPSQAG